MRAERTIVKLTTSVIRKENEIEDLRKEKQYEINKLKTMYDNKIELAERQLRDLCKEVDRCKDALE